MLIARLLPLTAVLLLPSAVMAIPQSVVVAPGDQVTLTCKTSFAWAIPDANNATAICAPEAPTSVPTRTPTLVPLPTATPVPICSASLQSLIDAAAPGSTMNVPACVYREMARVTKPLTLNGQGLAEIRGSDIWTGWTRTGNFWVKGPVPQLPTDNDLSHCQPNTDGRCLQAEQVFIDSTPLVWVPSNPQPGQFSLGSARSVILADNPSGRMVEVTTRIRWLDIQSDGVAVQGFRMRHAGNAAQQGAIGNQDRAGFRLRDNVLSDAHGAVVSVGGGRDTHILRNDISRGGQEGINGYKNVDTLIQGNHIHDNNVLGFNPEWEGGALKLAAFTNVTFDNNEVSDNAGSGLWCDILCSGVTISNNRIHRQPFNAIFFEISDDAQIYGNSIIDVLGWGSIVISSSGNADVHHNTITRAPAIRVQLDNRADRPLSAGTNIRVHDNVLFQPTDGMATSWWQVTPGQNGNEDTNNVTV
jgi:Right handed beta helix region